MSVNEGRACFRGHTRKNFLGGCVENGVPPTQCRQRGGTIGVFARLRGCIRTRVQVDEKGVLGLIRFAVPYVRVNVLIKPTQQRSNYYDTLENQAEEAPPLSLAVAVVPKLLKQSFGRSPVDLWEACSLKSIPNNVCQTWVLKRGILSI